MREALDIEVHGVVQGVGFRPFVFNAALRHNICGWVLNATAGVSTHWLWKSIAMRRLPRAWTKSI